jgi:proteasome lid subunit RPN8/RPN11
MTTRALRVFLPPPLGRAIVAHARRERPRECCGFLLGRGQRVQFSVPMLNVAASPTRYRIDDRTHIDVRRLLRAFTPALEIVGVYHSHPAGPSRPSPTDVAEAHYPEWIHVIADLSGARAHLAAFRIVHGQVRPVAIVR